MNRLPSVCSVYETEVARGVDVPAAYDPIADWYENEFLSDRSDDGLPKSDPIGVDGSLCEMLGQGVGLSRRS